MVSTGRIPFLALLFCFAHKGEFTHMCTGTCALVPAEREVHCDTTHITMVATSRALLSLVLLANLPPHADAAYECPLLVSSEQAPPQPLCLRLRSHAAPFSVWLRVDRLAQLLAALAKA